MGVFHVALNSIFEDCSCWCEDGFILARATNHTTIHIAITMNQCGSFALLTTEWKVLKSLYVLSHQVHRCIHQTSLEFSSISHHLPWNHMWCIVSCTCSSHKTCMSRSDVFSKCQSGWQTHVFSEDPWDKNLRCQKHLFVLAISTALNGRLGVKWLTSKNFSLFNLWFPNQKNPYFVMLGKGVILRLMFSSLMSFCTGRSNTLFFFHQGRNQMGCIHKKMHVYINIYHTSIIYNIHIFFCVCVCHYIWCPEDSRYHSPLTGILRQQFCASKKAINHGGFVLRRTISFGVRSSPRWASCESILSFWVFFWCKEYKDIKVNDHRMT